MRKKEEKELKTIDEVFELAWLKNWENARKFFESKGNLETKSKLKIKWWNDFFNTCLDVKRIIEESYEYAISGKVCHYMDPYIIEVMKRYLLGEDK